MNTKVYKLPIIVKHEVRVVQHKLTSYVRTRDIADSLGIKQPYEFNSDIREYLGDILLKGEQTEDFRSPDDNSRTPYVKVVDMIDFLQNGIIGHRTNGTTQEVINVLEQHMMKSVC